MFAALVPALVQTNAPAWPVHYSICHCFRARLAVVTKVPFMPDLMRQDSAVSLRPGRRRLNCAAYRPGWTFTLEDAGRHAGAYGLTLIIGAQTVNSDDPAEPYTATHYFWVPAESYDAQSWTRWLFDKIMLVELHEAMEFFTAGGTRPYPPGHGGGHDPYHALPV